MKKLVAAVLTALSIFAVSGVGLAAEPQWQIKEVVKETKFGEYKWPKFTLPNKPAEKNINGVIKKYAEDVIADDKRSSGIVSGGMTYEIKDDAPTRLTVIMESYNYHGGAHGMNYVGFFVFDKETGRRMEYTDFIPPLTDKEFVCGLAHNLFKVYALNDEKWASDTPFASPETKLVRNFYCKDDKTVVFVFPPYMLDCYAFGHVCVEVSDAVARELKAYCQNPELPLGKAGGEEN